MRKKGKRRREEERGRGGKVGGAQRDLDHTYPELSVARATLVSCFFNKRQQPIKQHYKLFSYVGHSFNNS